jgi:hypothetical protein
LQTPPYQTMKSPRKRVKSKLGQAEIATFNHYLKSVPGGRSVLR